MRAPAGIRVFGESWGGAGAQERASLAPLLLRCLLPPCDDAAAVAACVAAENLWAADADGAAAGAAGADDAALRPDAEPTQPGPEAGGTLDMPAADGAEIAERLVFLLQSAAAARGGGGWDADEAAAVWWVLGEVCRSVAGRARPELSEAGEARGGGDSDKGEPALAVLMEQCDEICRLVEAEDAAASGGSEPAAAAAAAAIEALRKLAAACRGQAAGDGPLSTAAALADATLATLLGIGAATRAAGASPDP